jgi:hypothetical protein
MSLLATQIGVMKQQIAEIDKMIASAMADLEKYGDSDPDLMAFLADAKKERVFATHHLGDLEKEQQQQHQQGSV